MISFLFDTKVVNSKQNLHVTGAGPNARQQTVNASRVYGCLWVPCRRLLKTQDEIADRYIVQSCFIWQSLRNLDHNIQTDAKWRLNVFYVYDEIRALCRGDPGQLSHKESWSTPIIFQTCHLFDLFFLQ